MADFVMKIELAHHQASELFIKRDDIVAHMIYISSGKVSVHANNSSIQHDVARCKETLNEKIQTADGAVELLAIVIERVILVESPVEGIRIQGRLIFILFALQLGIQTGNAKVVRIRYVKVLVDDLHLVKMFISELLCSGVDLARHLRVDSDVGANDEGGHHVGSVLNNEEFDE